MTAGLITIGEQLIAQLGIQKQRVAVRTMDFIVAADACELRAQTRMITHMPRRDRVALQAERPAGLGQQAIIDRTMRLMTFSAAAAFHQMVVDHWVLIKKWAGLIFMTALASPIEPDLEFLGGRGPQLMAIHAPDIPRFEGMSRSPLELHRRRRMTGDTEVVHILLYQVIVPVAMNRMARGAG